MAEGQTITFSTADYPQLEGMQEGASIPKITMTGNRVQSSSEGMITVEMGPCEFETENRADKDMREMTGHMAPGAAGNQQDHSLEY